MNLTDNHKARGFISIQDIDATTGEVIQETELDEQNVITAEGFDYILRNLVEKGGAITQDAVVKNIVLGDDVGIGSASNPTPPTANSISLDQNAVYTIPENDITFTYPATGSFSMGVLLDGNAIVTGQGVETINYTSASIRFVDGTTLSYKRFPVRTISGLINIRITWNIQFS